MADQKPTLDYGRPSRVRTPWKLIIAAVAIALGVGWLMWNAAHPPDFTDAPVFTSN
jgi:hypothetical protein